MAMLCLVSLGGQPTRIAIFNEFPIVESWWLFFWVSYIDYIIYDDIRKRRGGRKVGPENLEISTSGGFVHFAEKEQSPESIWKTWLGIRGGLVLPYLRRLIFCREVHVLLIYTHLFEIYKKM